MTFPATELPVLVELKVGATWTDITDDVRVSDGIAIVRGRADEEGEIGPSSCKLTVDNRTGKYSPRNPLGPYYGKIGRNTELRVSLWEEITFDASSSSVVTGGNMIWTHTPVVTKPSGVIVMVQQSASTAHELDTVTYGGFPMDVGGSIQTEGGVFYRYHLSGVNRIPGGPQEVSIQVDGPASKRAVAISFAGGEEILIRASGFFGGSGADPDLGIAVAKRGVLLGTIHSAHDAITSVSPDTGMTDVVEQDFGSDVWSVIRTIITQGEGVYSVGWIAPAEAWSAEVFAVEARSYRSWGEIAELPPRWDVSLNDGVVPVTANGILRRLGQGNAPARTGLKSWVLNERPFAYWALDEGELAGYGRSTAGLTQYKFVPWPPAKPWRPVFKFGAGEFGAGEQIGLPNGLQISDTAPDPFPGYMRADVGSGHDDGVAIDFVFRHMGTNPAEFRLHARDYNDNTWRLAMRAGAFDDIQLAHIETSTGTATGLADSLPLGELSDGELHHVRLLYDQDGADVQVTAWVDGVQVVTATRPATTMDGCSILTFTYEPTGTETPIAIGHVTVWDAGVIGIPPVADFTAAMRLFAGEPAGRRIERLCAELGVPFTAVGNLDDTVPVGPQTEGALLQHIRAAADADGGTLYEPRNALGLAYRTRVSTYNQPPTAVIDFAAGELAPSLEPTDDDQLTRNDVTVTRTDGGSFRAVLEEGPMSVEDPPSGVGRVEDEVTLNVASDDQLRDLAYWRLALGTHDEPRYPVVRVNRANANVVADAALSKGALTVDVDDRLVITNTDAIDIADDIGLLARGYAETMAPFTHLLDFNCSPSKPYEVAVYASDIAVDGDRYSPDESFLWTPITSGQTSFEVGTLTGPGWTDNDGDFDIMIGGERMTVTSITGGDGVPFFAGTGAGDSQNNLPVTAGLPPSALAGDLVLILASIRNSGVGAPVTPANWGLIANLGNARLFGRNYDGVWTMPAVTFTGGAAGEDTIAQSCALRGLSMLDAEVDAQLNASGQNIATPDFGPASGIARAVLYLGWKQDDWTTISLPPAGSTLINARVGTALDAGQAWAIRILRNQKQDIPAGQFTVTGGAAAISRGAVVVLNMGQTFHVTRSVNGIVKPHLAGLPNGRITLANPARYAL